jgi:hypothetical protein
MALVASRAGSVGLACDAPGWACRRTFWPRKRLDIRSLARIQGWIITPFGDFCGIACQRRFSEQQPPSSTQGDRR